jgi:hypothetical protein
MISDTVDKFHGLKVVPFKAAGDIKDFAAVAPKLLCEYDDDDNSLASYLSTLLDEPGVSALKALVFGLWCEDGDASEATPREAIELLVASKEKLPNLEALFVGDIVGEENEISWIQNADLSPLWAAFPKLQEFRVRGSNQLRLGKINHSALKSLAVECGGLPAGVAREALEANAPLEHFELWFGSDNYGLTTTIAQLNDLFDDKLFPKLKTLALRNCDFADAIAERLATSKLLARIENLDLSMGTLRDDGANALIASGKLGHLKSLDISHHYVSEDVIKRLAAATPNLIADDAQEADDEDSYYVSVSE